MTRIGAVTPSSLEAAAALGNLPLSPDRGAELTPVFAGLIAAANQLSATIARDRGHPNPVPPLFRFSGP